MSKQSSNPGNIFNVLIYMCEESVSVEAVFHLVGCQFFKFSSRN